LHLDQIAVPDVVESAADADILIFVLPHQFMSNTCKPLVGKIKPSAFGVSLCKASQSLISNSILTFGF
jgi:glycerol-3-phosphate dehydrogenase (NAD+)